MAIIPADPEKVAAKKALVEEARKGRQEAVNEIMETSVRPMRTIPAEQESRASEEGKAIASEMEQAIGRAPVSPAAEEPKPRTDADTLRELVEEHGEDWVTDILYDL